MTGIRRDGGTGRAGAGGHSGPPLHVGAGGPAGPHSATSITGALTGTVMLPRKARMGDVAGMQRMINEHAEHGRMLPRSLSQLYENLRDFWVIEDGVDIVGCGALHINWDNLAEVRSLAVEEGHQGKGAGRALVFACIEEARELGLSRIFALTREPDFFQHLGFKVSTVDQMPRKVWGECINCPKFPECDEVAMVMDL